MKTRSMLKFDSPAEMSAAVLGTFVNYLLSVLAVKANATVALSGGSSPLGFYTLLSKQGNEELLPWDRIHWFWADERFVPENSQDSNYGSAREAFLQDLKISDANLHPINTAYADPEAAAVAYRKKLYEFFGHGIPFFDLMLLGMGQDGHTASLFPGSPALLEKNLMAVAVPPPELISPHLPRITVTFPVINRAGKIIMITSGEEKQHLIDQVQEDGKHQYPVQRIENTNMVWFVSKI